MCKFGKIIENDYKKGFVGHVCFIKFYALSWKKMSHFLARFIHTQKRKQVNHPRGNNLSTLVDMACIVQIAKRQQRFECFK
jgi:hypothetical protein